MESNNTARKNTLVLHINILQRARALPGFVLSVAVLWYYDLAFLYKVRGEVSNISGEHPQVSGASRRREKTRGIDTDILWWI
jgi:hypothetical protein